MTIASAVVAVILGQVSPLLAQAKDPLIGVWVFDRGKSSFSQGTDIGKRILTFEAVKDGIKHTTDTTENLNVGGGGFSFPDSYQVVYTFKFDGKDNQVLGASLDTVSFKRVNSSTIERTGKIMGMVVETATWTISPDGKILTMTTKGTSDGTEYTSVQVFNRQ